MVADDTAEGTSEPPATPLGRELTEAEIEALEDAEDARIADERFRRAEWEGTIPWEEVERKLGSAATRRELTKAEIEALEQAEDIRISLERLNTEETVSWESVKAKHGL